MKRIHLDERVARAAARAGADLIEGFEVGVGWAGLGWVLGGAAAVMVGRGMQALAHLCDGQGYKIIHEGAAAMVGRGMLALAHLCDEQGFIGL